MIGPRMMELLAKFNQRQLKGSVTDYYDLSAVEKKAWDRLTKQELITGGRRSRVTDKGRAVLKG